jgi:hypothetical protein
MLRNRCIPTWLVFTSQVECDTRYILESETDQGFIELQKTAHRMRISELVIPSLVFPTL